VGNDGPAITAILLCVVLYGIGSMMFSGYNFDSLLAKIITLALLGIVGMSVINGYVYAKWLS
jgi:membrane protein YdbS with pleckstrin-like domain